MNRLILILIVVFSVSACVSPNYNYAPPAMQASRPVVDSINTVYVGDPMLRQGSYAQHDAILLKKSITVGGIGRYTLAPGYYKKTGDDSYSGFYLPSNYGSNKGHVTASTWADPFQVVQAYNEKQKICAITIFGGKVCSSNVEYTTTTQRVITDDSFQQTLIYSGMIGDKINLSYREFLGSIARPAFSNDVEYDLSASSIVGYKGAKIEIITATNEYIKYRVIANFNTPR